MDENGCRATARFRTIFLLKLHPLIRALFFFEMFFSRNLFRYLSNYTIIEV